jgi:putative hydrolase of the HAD superfamily
MAFLDHYSAVLLDMNGTFMFDCDRFGPGEDYYATYVAAGGRRLDRAALMRIMQAGLDGILRDYETPARYEDFPSVSEAFERYTDAPAAELPLLEQVFARHEIGRVPPATADFLRSLAETHRLGIVSNICAKPDPWLGLFRETGLLSLFSTVVFSSEGRAIKPSHRLFRRALDELPSDATVLFVGDSLVRDILPAKALGLDTVWVAPDGSAHPAADAVIPRLTDLAFLPTHDSLQRR